MIQPCQDVPLLPEASQDIVRCQAALDEFDCHRLMKLAIGPDRLVDPAHAPTPDLAHQHIRADPNARRLGLRGAWLSLRFFVVHASSTARRDFKSSRSG